MVPTRGGWALIGGLFVAYKLRIRRLVELEQLRLRIASDLHDELGSELSGIALASRLIGRHDELTEKDRSRLADVASAAARVTAGLRDIVWYISPEEDTLESLEQRMKSVARTMLDGIAYEFRSSGIRPVPLDMDRRRHLFLIYKEVLHNILRHAEATRVTIALEAHAGALRLEIVDNGVGMSRRANERDWPQEHPPPGRPAWRDAHDRQRTRPGHANLPHDEHDANAS